MAKLKILWVINNKIFKNNTNSHSKSSGYWIDSLFYNLSKDDSLILLYAYPSSKEFSIENNNYIFRYDNYVNDLIKIINYTNPDIIHVH